jgi:hypothetical protein
MYYLYMYFNVGLYVLLALHEPYVIHNTRLHGNEMEPLGLNLVFPLLPLREKTSILWHVR